MLSFETYNGGTIEITHHAASVDMHLRAADGRTVATVEMSPDDADGLIRDLRNPRS